MKIVMMLVMLFVLTACDDAVPPPRTPMVKPQSRAGTPSEDDDKPDMAKVKALVDRAHAAAVVAFDTITEAGELVKKEFDELDRCPLPKGTEKADPKMIAPLATCALKELADVLAKDPDPEMVLQSSKKVARGEELARLAKASLEARKAEDAEQERKFEADQEALFVAAKATCEKDASTCKRKCDAGGHPAGPFCVFVASRLVKENKFEEARKALQTACKAGVRQACELIPKLEATMANFPKKKQEAFAEVASVADDIASKMFVMSNAQKLGGRAARAVPRMRLVIQASIRETYCPAKKAAMDVLTLAEFSKMAAAKCKDDPPTGTGLSGSEVPLPNECRQVFASGCPLQEPRHAFPTCASLSRPHVHATTDQEAMSWESFADDYARRLLDARDRQAEATRIGRDIRDVTVRYPDGSSAPITPKQIDDLISLINDRLPRSKQEQPGGGFIGLGGTDRELHELLKLVEQAAKR